MRKFSLSTLRRVAFFLFLLLFGAIVMRWISLERLRLTMQRIAPQIVTIARGTPNPPPTPTRPPLIGGKLDTAKLWSGITVHAQVEPTPGGFAMDERADPQSYVLDLGLKVRVPSPNESIDDLAKITPDLPKLLPGLATALQHPVSPLYRELYDIKLQMLRENLVRLDQLLSRHNFYDCQTILYLRDPTTKRKAVLLQADMDVDADGSDADRLPITAGDSLNFKPFTSYRWKKKTAQPNAFLPAAEEKLTGFQTESARPGLTMERRRDLRAGIQRMHDEIDSLKRFSFLVAATDPYIVLPGIFLHGENAVRVGDYAVVAVNGQLYPAIVGDIGPNDRVGEASLRIAKEINALATAANRPVSDLKVSYIIFPRTADTPFGSPDLEKMQARCDSLVKEIGGASVPLHHWENLIPPSPTPTPTPTSSASTMPSSSGTPTTTPSASFAFPTSTASPTPTPSASASP